MRLSPPESNQEDPEPAERLISVAWNKILPFVFRDVDGSIERAHAPLNTTDKNNEEISIGITFFKDPDVSVDEVERVGEIWVSSDFEKTDKPNPKFLMTTYDVYIHDQKWHLVKSVELVDLNEDPIARLLRGEATLIHESMIPEWLKAHMEDMKRKEMAEEEDRLLLESQTGINEVSPDELEALAALIDKAEIVKPAQTQC